ncbi:HDOD domain-containing protein [Undibacterium sp. WLX3042]|uniref:HDOD domain-containing protein n=1 Tax=Undibacterium sp. WLX3042 TaxID=3412686 RepID=UPI003C2E39DE
MNPPSTAHVASDQSVDALIKTIRIPPRPSMLLDLQTELSRKEPDPVRLAAIISNDVSLSASLLKVTNSSFFGLRLKATSVAHAVKLLGIQQCGLLMTGIIARQAVQTEKIPLAKFWDFSSKRAQAMAHLASRMRICSADIAHTFGLFCDIGIPLLLERFPDYQETLVLANQEAEEKFTTIEQQRHSTSHTSIGALMARTWGLPEEVSNGILLHHDYAVLADSATDERVRALVALALVAEYGIHRYHGQEHWTEWDKGGQLARDFLGLANDEVEDRFEELHDLFSSVH